MSIKRGLDQGISFSTTFVNFSHGVSWLTGSNLKSVHDNTHQQACEEYFLYKNLGTGGINSVHILVNDTIYSYKRA
jgi:hypothetical protein